MRPFLAVCVIVVATSLCVYGQGKSIGSIWDCEIYRDRLTGL